MMVRSEPMEDVLFTVPEVAEILRTNVDYVYKLRRSGLLRFIKIGRLKCRKSTLEAFLEKYEGLDVSDPFDVKEVITDEEE